MSKVPMLEFDTALLPPERRFETWRVAVSDYDLALPSGFDPAGFYARTSSWLLGDLVISDGELSPIRFARSLDKARQDAADHFVFLLLRKGGWTGDFEGRTLTAGPGQIVAFDLTRPFEAAGIESDSISLRVARKQIAAAIPPGANLHGFVFRGVTGRVLTDHLLVLVKQLASMDESEAPAATKATINLIASCVAVSPDVPMSLPPPAELALRHRINRYIDNNLGARQLTPAAICEALDVSRSVAYRAFAPLGGIAANIRSRRLEVVHVLLDDRREKRDIAKLMTDFGFISTTHFSRAFRAHFGYPPRQARARARRDFLTIATALSAETGPAVFREWVRLLG